MNKTWLLLTARNIVADRRTTTIKQGSACSLTWTVLHWREPTLSNQTKVQTIFFFYLFSHSLKLCILNHYSLLLTDTDYLENNCVEEPTKLCEFKKMGGRILKTVDSVYQDVQTVEECRELCLNSPFRCHSYDHGDTGDHVCRLSHHSRATLADIQVNMRTNFIFYLYQFNKV